MSDKTAVTNDEYKCYIKEMLDQIENNKDLRKLYTFTVKYYLHTNTERQEVQS